MFLRRSGVRLRALCAIKSLFRAIRSPLFWRLALAFVRTLWPIVWLKLAAILAACSATLQGWFTSPPPNP